MGRAGGKKKKKNEKNSNSMAPLTCRRQKPLDISDLVPIPHCPQPARHQIQCIPFPEWLGNPSLLSTAFAVTCVPGGRSEGSPSEDGIKWTPSTQI